jgi:hypothetical protein
MLLSYRPITYKGLYFEGMTYPYEFTVKIKTIFGTRVKKYMVNVDYKLNVPEWFADKKLKWVKKLPWHKKY